MSELPHKPGSQMATRLSPLARNKVEDNYSANIVGQNNTTGRPIVATEGSNQTVEAVADSGNYRVGETVDVARDRSTERSGSRRAGAKRYSATLGGGSSDSRPSQNSGFSTPDTTGCKTTFSISVTRNEAPPPEPPPETPPPAPDNPEPGDEAEGTPEQGVPNGCDPQSNSQWYNSPDGEPTSCPAGTNYLGFAQLGEGAFMVLCEGPSRPAGDGCPTSPTGNGQFQQGYECELGTCVLKPGGRFATLAECQATGCPTTGYRFVGGTCSLVPIADAVYDSLAECQAANPPTYACVGGVCTPSESGPYATLAECQASACELPTGVSFRIRHVEVETSTASPGSTPFQFGTAPGNAIPGSFSATLGNNGIFAAGSGTVSLVGGGTNGTSFAFGATFRPVSYRWEIFRVSDGAVVATITKSLS